MMEETSSTARNLSHAFDALCITDDAHPSLQVLDNADNEQQQGRRKTKSATPLISPTSVGESLTTFEDNTSSTDLFDRLEAAPESAADTSLLVDDDDQHSTLLHADLARELTHACLERVSLYSIIHDINKEATAMAAADTCPGLDEEEELAPLTETASSTPETPVHANTGVASNTMDATSTATNKSPCSLALVDEEEWLLATIASREPSEPRACPDTFLQAMGEQDYDNTSTRTQLWKPSRSWWEAKSGKNPWMEPTLHNKRWR
jgi:hypothetical protein